MAIISRFAPIVYEDFEIPSGENWDEEILEHEAQIAVYLAPKKEEDEKKKKEEERKLKRKKRRKKRKKKKGEKNKEEKK